MDGLTPALDTGRIGMDSKILYLEVSFLLDSLNIFITNSYKILSCTAKSMYNRPFFG